jgi:hypothetical protein
MRDEGKKRAKRERKRDQNGIRFQQRWCRYLISSSRSLCRPIELPFIFIYSMKSTSNGLLVIVYSSIRLLLMLYYYFLLNYTPITFDFLFSSTLYHRSISYVTRTSKRARERKNDEHLGASSLTLGRMKSDQISIHTHIWLQQWYFEEKSIDLIMWSRKSQLRRIIWIRI